MGRDRDFDCLEAVAAGGLHFAAVAAIQDPVREDVPAAVGQCLRAGIGVKIVTGDTPATAREIARQIGLWDDARDTERNHITGADFAAASDGELLERVQELKIMSRARPLDKQRLVRLLQQRGEVVAVTGDGTNDAPALNFANVGLSMGSGTSVAKDASDITLLDDSFASIATAVMWGRSLYRNIQRFVLFQLTINFVAILICFVGAVFGTDMPLTVVQILWVNIIMDTFAAMAMASLPPSAEVMEDRPRRCDEFIISPAMARTIFACGIVMVAVLLGLLFGWTFSAEGMTVHQLTLFFSTFVFLQFWNMFNAKGFETHHSVFTCLKGMPRVLPYPAGHRRGSGARRRVRRRGLPHRAPPWKEWPKSSDASLLAIGGEIIRRKSAEKIAQNIPDAIGFFSRTILLLMLASLAGRGRSPTNRQRRLERRRRIPKTNRPPHLHENLSDALRRSAPDRRRRRHAVLRLRFPPAPQRIRPVVPPGV